MPFQLTIAEGQESGKAFTFEQPSITIGRTDECDVVLYDTGVSRQHARIFTEGVSYFVEDMGSANGTRVNGQTVKKQQLAEGDAVSLGAVVFKFSEKIQTQGLAANGAPAVNHTRIVSKDEIQKKRAFLPSNASPEQASALERKQTLAMSANDVEQALARKGPPPAAVKAAAPAVSRLSAAERARIRRENPGLVGTAKLFWLDAPDRTRQLLAASGGVVLLGLIGLTYYLALYTPDNRPTKPPEPSELGRTTIHESFGLGDGVDYRRRDNKVFEFKFNASTKALIILHYQSRDISEGEVDVAVNGTSVGKLPADTVDRLNELILPPSLVKRGERNVLSFDNVRNPPGSDTWRVWDLWLEISLLPDMPQEQLLREARDAYQRGQVAYERRDVGAESRYMAWRDFREAWLKLEAYPDPKPDLYRLARERMREAQQELDHTCKKLMLEVEAYYHHHDFTAARHTLDYVHEYFPGNDQPCPRLAETKRGDYGL